MMAGLPGAAQSNYVNFEGSKPPRCVFQPMGTRCLREHGGTGDFRSSMRRIRRPALVAEIPVGLERCR